MDKRNFDFSLFKSKNWRLVGYWICCLFVRAMKNARLNFLLQRKRIAFTGLAHSHTWSRAKLHFTQILVIEIMETITSTSLKSSTNCCCCDKDLTPGSIKYKCPGCERLYCKADCFKGHKEKFSCIGIRDRVPYVHLSRFDQKQFLDDYFFLEDIGTKIERAQRVLPKLTRCKVTAKNRRKNKKQ